MNHFQLDSIEEVGGPGVFERDRTVWKTVPIQAFRHQYHFLNLVLNLPLRSCFIFKKVFILGLFLLDLED